MGSLVTSALGSLGGHLAADLTGAAGQASGDSSQASLSQQGAQTAASGAKDTLAGVGQQDQDASEGRGDLALAQQTNRQEEQLTREAGLEKARHSMVNTALGAMG
jgi:hypothetical protein